MNGSTTTLFPLSLLVSNILPWLKFHLFHCLLPTEWKTLYPSQYTDCALSERLVPVLLSESLFNWVTNCRSWQHTKVKEKNDSKAVTALTLPKLDWESKSKQSQQPDSKCQEAFKEQRRAIKAGGLTRRFNIPPFGNVIAARFQCCQSATCVITVIIPQTLWVIQLHLTKGNTGTLSMWAVHWRGHTIHRMDTGLTGHKLPVGIFGGYL